MSWTPTHVQVTVYRAKNLIHKGKGDTNDAYVTIKQGEEKYQTSIKERSHEPAWMEECDLPLEDRSGCVIMNTYHRNLLGIDEFLGHVTISLDQFQVHEKPRSKWYALKNKPGSKKPEKYRGEIEVKITFIVQSLTGSSLGLNKTGRVKRSNSIKSFAHTVGEKMTVKWPRRESLSNKSIENPEYSPGHSRRPSHNDADGEDSPTVQVMSRHDISRGHDILPTSFNNYSEFKSSRSKKLAQEDEDTGSDPSSINKPPPVAPKRSKLRQRLAKLNPLSQSSLNLAKRPSSGKKNKDKSFDAPQPILQKTFFAKSMYDLTTTTMDDLTDAQHHQAPSSDCDEDYETYSLSSSEEATPAQSQTTPPDMMPEITEEPGSPISPTSPISPISPLGFPRFPHVKKNRTRSEVKSQTTEVKVQDYDSSTNPFDMDEDEPDIVVCKPDGVPSDVEKPVSPVYGRGDLQTAPRASVPTEASTEPPRQEQKPDDPPRRSNTDNTPQPVPTIIVHEETPIVVVKETASESPVLQRTVSESSVVGKSEQCGKPVSTSLQSINESGRSSLSDTTTPSPIHQRETPEGKEKHPALHEGHEHISPPGHGSPIQTSPRLKSSPRDRHVVRSSSSSSSGGGRLVTEDDEEEDRASPIERGKRMKDVGRLGVGGGTLRRLPRVGTHELHEGILEYKRERDQRASCELPEHVLQQFAGYEREDFIRMILEQRVSMKRKDQSCRDMENYIDNLLVKVMEETPKLLQSRCSPPKPVRIYTTPAPSAVSNNRTAAGRLQGSGQPLRGSGTVSYHSGAVSIGGTAPHNGSSTANNRSLSNANNSSNVPTKKSSSGKKFNNPFKKIQLALK